ncbi:uncharacterized protein [Rutidosis leptorrhynchoides]|uniref:uncharacterized protein isoform X2 n=1 Tax=Rutidosis leptorrhynchoides TaxID=125765 RepID=UPI003A99029A
MVDEDDDFGDLYADVEVEAISAINVAPQISNSQVVSVETGKHDNDKIEIASGDSDYGYNDEDDDDDDDDDDDLDIVLNSDDDNVRHNDGITVVRTNTNLGTKEADDADDDNLRTEEFTRGKGVCNSHSMYKYIRPQPAAYGSDLKASRCATIAYLSQEDNGYYQRMGSRSMGPQQRFSLPWSRNILDVNIDIFEQKPWKNPGVDITDYFNFGFNEDTWKRYCNQVDEYRHRGLMYSWTPASEPAQLTDTDREGQAIEVEESIVERQSTMDVTGHIDRDSDAIKIPILDPGEHFDSYVPETSNQKDVTGGDDDDDDMGHLSLSIASEDESVVGSQMEMDIQAPKRSSGRKISTELMRRSSENDEVHQVSEGSGGTVQAIRFLNNSKDTCTTDQSILVAESSELEKSSASYLEDYNKSDHKTEYGRNNYHAKDSTPVYNYRNHGEFKHKLHDVNDDSYSRRLGDKREHDNRIYHPRCKVDVYDNRSRRDFDPKSLHEHDIYSRRTYDERRIGEHRYYARKCHSDYDLETYHEKDDYFSTSRIAGSYDVESTIDHERRIERLRSFDPYNEEEIYLKSELPSDNYGERFSIYELRDAERYGNKMDRSVFGTSEDEKYYDDRRRYVDDNRIMEGDRWINERGSHLQRRESLYYRNKGENDYLRLEREYPVYMQEEQFGPYTYNGREEDEVERVYEKDVEHTRWDFRGAEKNKIRVLSPSSELNNSLLKRYESSEESRTNNGRWHSNMMPRDKLFSKHERFRSRYSEPYMNDFDNHVNMERTRHGWRYEYEYEYEMQLKEDEILFRHEDDKFYAERASLPFEKDSRHKMFVSDYVESVDDPCEWLFKGGTGSPGVHLVGGYEYDHVEPLTDGPRAKRDRYKLKKEVFSGNKFAKPLEERLSQNYRNSLDSHMVVGDGKSSEKHIKPKWMGFNSRLSDKAAQTVKSKAVDKGLDIKKGQNLTKEVNIGPAKDDPVAHVNDVNKLQNKNGEKGLDETRILEAMAKMEKRRARFNEPVMTCKKDSDTAGDSVIVADLNKQHRPARKRRWGGS